MASSITEDIKKQIAHIDSWIAYHKSEIEYNRSLRVKGISDARYDELSAIIEKNKAELNSAKARLGTLKIQLAASIQADRAAEQQKEQERKEKVGAAGIKKLQAINTATIESQKANEDLPQKSDAQQQVANAAAPSVPQPAQEPQQPSGVLPAFTKFSGLGASQMRGQMSSPPQNVIGSQQNAFTLPNAQGIKFGGT